MCLMATTQGSGLVISVLERDIKVQHVPERAVSWLVATGPCRKSDKCDGCLGPMLGGRGAWGPGSGETCPSDNQETSTGGPRNSRPYH